MMKPGTSTIGPDAPRLGRRAVLAGLAALPVGGLASGAAVAAAIPPSGRMTFTIQRGETPIGTHVVEFRPRDRRLTVGIAIDLTVTLGPVPVFRYTHRNTEIWDGSRLIALDTTTYDGGERFAVTARAVEGGLRVDGVEGTFVAPADIVPSSYWDMRVVRQTRLLDTQRGIIRTITSRRLGEEPITAAGRTITAARWRIADTLAMDIWYSRPGQFVKLALTVRDQPISYALRPAPPGAPVLVPGY